METLILKNTISDIEKAGEIIASGGLVAFPTETVYGLGADALNGDAVGKVYAAKGRPSDNPMIVHISSKDDFAKLTPEITENMNVLMDKFWPGPLTMVVKRKAEIPNVTTGGLDTVGIRMPSNEDALNLIRLSGCPIAAPSANLSGKPSPTKASHVIDDLSGRIDAIIVGGDSELGIESTVVDMTGDVPMILRPGMITKRDLEDALGMDVLLDPTLNKRPDEMPGSEFKPKAPGMKYKHYAPKAKMTVFEGEHDAVKAAIALEKELQESQGNTVEVIYFENSEAARAAREFFAKLREADKNDVDVILAAALAESDIGFSVMNRMLKSAGYNIRKVK